MNCNLYQGDCLEVMKSLTGIDVVITDPPFNAGKDFENDNLSPLDFRAFCNEFALRLYRLKPANILVEVGKDDKIMREELDRYFKFEYQIVLNYTNAMRNGKVGYSNYGLVLWYSNGGKVVTRYKDRIDCALHSTIGEFSHPSPKEVGHYRHLVRMFSDVGQVVLDPFLGSGTTGIAAVGLGRKFVGIEKDADYFQLAKRRIAESTFQLCFKGEWTSTQEIYTTPARSPARAPGSRPQGQG